MMEMDEFFPPFFFNMWGGTLGTAATTALLYQPRIIGDGDCGEIGGMKIGRGNRTTRRKPAPVPLCPPQTPHATRMRTRAAAVGSQRLTAWTMARPRMKFGRETSRLRIWLLTVLNLQLDVVNSLVNSDSYALSIASVTRHMGYCRGIWGVK
jgi:hypothetical protein